MPLTFNAGDVKTFQLQAEAYQAYPRHWVGREYKACSGPGCALCAAGVSARKDYTIPISIAGVADTWTFSSGVAQQLDVLTQQGKKLLGLVVKVSRTGQRTDTRYQIEAVGEQLPVVSPKPAPPAGATAPAVVSTPAKPYVTDQESLALASQWAKTTQALLYDGEFLTFVARKIKAMKDEGLWG